MIYIVTGANYGDEGKGNIVSYLARKHTNSIVIRHNGGSQAQHRVIDKEGVTFIFGHIGSGTLEDRPTFLSKYFITNPMILKKEFDEFKMVSTKIPQVLIDTRSRVTTLYDMMYNQLHSDTLKNGSCGLGVRATIERNEVIDLNFGHLRDTSKVLTSILQNIRNYYARRMRYEKRTDDEINKIMSIEPDTHASELVRCATLAKFLTPDTIVKCLHDYSVKIFEGAQGLLLTQDNFESFPHLTPSNTGILNAERLITQNIPRFSDQIIEYIFVTRTYMTRHGNGPFENETMPTHVRDFSNKSNEFQGDFKMRSFNEDDIDDLKARVLIEMDRTIFPEAYKTRKINFATTHWDQIQNEELMRISKYIAMGPRCIDVFSREFDWNNTL